MTDTKQVGQEVEQSDALDHAVRVGLVAYGVVHLALAWICLQLALGSHPAQASTKGALHELARQPFGIVLVWGITIGMFLLVLWRLLEAAVGHRHEQKESDRYKKRATSLLKAIIYAAIGVSAFKTAIGAGSSSGGSKGMTATVMGWPAGQWLVALAGLAIVGYGGNVAWRGWKEKFLEHLDAQGRSGDTGTAYKVFGKVGYIGKGASLAIVGFLFVGAGIKHKSSDSGGLDQALEKLLREPFGPVLIALIALGLACYGLFCFARARHLNR